MKLLYATSQYLLLFPAIIIHKAFANMVLTEEDEIVVPLCLIVIALAIQHLNGPRIILSSSTKKCILGSPYFVRRTSKWGPKELKNFLRMDLQTFEELQELQVNWPSGNAELWLANSLEKCETSFKKQSSVIFDETVSWNTKHLLKHVSRMYTPFNLCLQHWVS